MDVYKIDNKGFYIGIEDVAEMDEFCITTPIQVGKVHPKWNVSEWVEGATPEEIRSWQKANQPQTVLQKILKLRFH